MIPLPQRSRFIDRSRNLVDKSVAYNKPSNDPLFASHYLNCRYAPFNRAARRTGIPDGRGVNVVVRDYKTSYDIVTGGFGTEIRIAPMFPFPVRFAVGTSGGGNVNTIAIGNEFATPASVPATSQPYIGCTLPTAMSTLLPTIPGGQADSTNIISARIVTIGYRLYYTGKAADAFGVVLVDNLPFKVDGEGLNNNAFTQWGVGSPGASGKNQTVGNNACPILVVDNTPFGVNQSNAPVTQVTLRPESGVEGVLKYQSNPDAHEFKPWYDQGAAVVCSASSDTNLYTPIYASTQAVTIPSQDRIFGAFCVDDALQEVNIRITGATQSFRLEVVVCIEQELATSSNMIDMAKPSPTLDRALLDFDGVINSGAAPAAFSQSVSAMMGKLSLSPRRPRRRNRKPKPPPPKPKPKKKKRKNKCPA
nr:hypothetical protein [Tolivirales sp.]